jgi:hypothetical protein
VTWLPRWQVGMFWARLATSATGHVHMVHTACGRADVMGQGVGWMERFMVEAGGWTVVNGVKSDFTLHTLHTLQPSPPMQPTPPGRACRTVECAAEVRHCLVESIPLAHQRSNNMPGITPSPPFGCPALSFFMCMSLERCFRLDTFLCTAAKPRAGD